MLSQQIFTARNLQTLSLKHKYTRDWEQRQDLVVKQNQILQCFANSEIAPLPCKTYLCFLESSPSCGQSPHLSKHDWETELRYHGSQNLGRLAFPAYFLVSVDYLFPPNILTMEKSLSPPPSQSLPIPFEWQRPGSLEGACTVVPL